MQDTAGGGFALRIHVPGDAHQDVNTTSPPSRRETGMADA